MAAWLVLFWGLAAFFYWLDQSSWFKNTVNEPYARFSALLSSKLLFLLGLECRLDGNALVLAGKTFTVAESCTGSFVFFLVAAVILAFPASWKEKLCGLGGGFVTVFLLNLLRTLSIVLLASRFPGSFWGMHVIAGQALMIAGSTLFFIWWARGVGQGGALLLPGRRLRAGVLLYVGAFIVSYGIYNVFLGSSFGVWSMDLVIRHAAQLLGLLVETQHQGQMIQTARSSIRVVHSCLSSPVLVLFQAAIVLLPFSWPGRLLIYAATFFPLYYFYHVTRTVFAIWFMGAGRDVNFAYNFFGQVALVKALLLFSVYYWAGRRRVTSFGRQLLLMLLAVLPAFGLALLVGSFWRDHGLPFLWAWFGSGGMFYNPGRIISLMPVFHSFIWLALMLTTPVPDRRRLVILALGGIVGINLLFALAVSVVLVLNLAPHPWLLKTVNIFLPFIVWLLVLQRQKEFGAPVKMTG